MPSRILLKAASTPSEPGVAGVVVRGLVAAGKAVGFGVGVGFEAGSVLLVLALRGFALVVELLLFCANRGPASIRIIDKLGIKRFIASPQLCCICADYQRLN